jgi:hypothetical protein
MAEDRGILEAIGSILQKWELGKSKKPKKVGIKSNLGDKDILRKIATKNPYMTSQLTADKMDNRIDEGALMRLRTMFPNI